MPHVTLVPFFRTPDRLVADMVDLLYRVVESERRRLPHPLRLESYVSPNFMGFFVEEEGAQVLKTMAGRFVDGLASMDIQVEAPTQALHLTLAYHFPAPQFSQLEHLVKAIDPSCQGEWELRLFSRDIRQADKEVYRVVYPHVPRETDELELLLGDFVYVDGESWKSSIDGWVEGTSWLTGCTGFLPKNYIDKIEESDAWTLHKIFKLNVADRGAEEAEPRQTESSRLAAREPTPVENPPAVDAAAYEEDAASNSLPVARIDSPLAVKQGPRSVFIVRHGERVDFTFGSWIPYCFDESGKYMQKDLNMPVAVPHRKGAPESFAKDTPLTCVGETQARLLGEALRLRDIDVAHVFCSPSLRSMQTCRNILRGLQVDQRTPIAHEPGLFEWLAWYQDSLPQFMSDSELEAAGFRLRRDHRPFIAISKLGDRRETSEQYYMRSHYVVQCSLRSTAHLGGNILLVGHASTLDACSRQLVGGSPRSAQELSRIVHRIPYCSMAVVQGTEPDGSHPEVGHSEASEKDEAKGDAQGKRWRLVEPPVPPMTYSANMRFDWQTLISEN